MRLAHFLKVRLLRHVKWQDVEHFNMSWKERISYMAQLIDDDTSTVMDFGCGEMWLRDYLSPTVQYFGVDYKRRDGNTIVCDFNRRQFPDGSVDVAFCSGVIEYIEDIAWFLDRLAGLADTVIASYVVTENSCKRMPTWVNAFSTQELVDMFAKAGFTRHFRPSPEDIAGNRIFRFTKSVAP